MPQIELILCAPDQAAPASLQEIYEAAFPPEERRPWTQLSSSRAQEQDLQLLYINKECVGLAVTWRLAEALYCEYLLIDDRYRGQGLGAEVIKHLRQLTQGLRPLVLECEPRGYSPEAERRLGFYARLGLEPQPYDYMQPPYGEGLPWVPLHLLSDQLLSLEQYEAIRTALYRQVYQVAAEY